MFDDYRFRQFDDWLNEQNEEILTRLGRGGFFQDKYKDFKPPEGSPLYDFYVGLWGGNTNRYEYARELVRTIAYTRSKERSFQDILESYRQAVSNPAAASSIMSKVFILIKGTRLERWKRLEEAKSVRRPTSFLLWRGIPCESHDYIADVIMGWRSGQPLVPQVAEISSWSVRRTVAERFALSAKGKPGIVIRADVPFEDTLLDKWVDDCSMVVPWARQDEVVVSTRQPNSFRIPGEAVTVHLPGGIVYTQGMIADLQSALGFKQGG